MSIINDALKKAQQSLEKIQVEKISTHKRKIHSSEDPKNQTSVHLKTEPIVIKSSNLKNAAIIIFVLLFFALAGKFVILNLSKINDQQITTIETEPEPIPTPPPAVIQEAEPIQQSNIIHETSPDILVLKGTMKMGEDRVALINEEVYEVGEFVNGRKIIDINLKNVELLENGKTIILKVRK